MSQNHAIEVPSLPNLQENIPLFKIENATNANYIF